MVLGFDFLLQPPFGGAIYRGGVDIDFFLGCYRVTRACCPPPPKPEPPRPILRALLAPSALFFFNSAELELERIQTRMAQKPMLWAEVGKSALFPRKQGGLSLWVSGPRPMDL